MFVPLAVGQVLAFAAKVSTAMIIPQVTYFMSIHTPQEALQISFFSSLSNCIATALDTRNWLQQSSQAAGAPKRYWSVKTTAIIAASLLLWLVILVSDLLVFQFAQTSVEWRSYPATDLKLDFTLSEYAHAGSTKHQIPAALINSDEAYKAFQNNTYIPGEQYQYLNHAPTPVYALNEPPFVLDMSPGVARISIEQEQQCVGGQMLTVADYGEVAATITCPVDPIANAPLVYGFNKRSLVRGLQTAEGAYFQFTTSKQRDAQNYKEANTNLTRTRNILAAMEKSYSLAALATDQKLSTEMDTSVALEYLSGWKGMAANRRRVKMLFYTLESDKLYNQVPRHTYNYLLVGISVTKAGAVSVKTISYTARNVFVPQAEIEPAYLTNALGIKTADIVTDVSEEHAIISLLKDPKTPIQFKSVSTIDAKPAIIVTVLSLGISLIFYTMSMVHRIFQRSAIPFNPYLEVFHKALESPVSDSTVSLIKKIQNSDLVLVNGVDAVSGQAHVGLVPGSDEGRYTR